MGKLDDRMLIPSLVSKAPVKIHDHMKIVNHPWPMVDISRIKGYVVVEKGLGPDAMYQGGVP